MNFFEIKDGALFFKRRQEIMEICPWGAGLRVRATQNRSFSDKDWALDVPAKAGGKITFIFDPRIYSKSFDAVAFVLFLLLSLLPVIIDLTEEILWKISYVKN